MCDMCDASSPFCLVKRSNPNKQWNITDILVGRVRTICHHLPQRLLLHQVLQVPDLHRLRLRELFEVPTDLARAKTVALSLQV